MRITVLVHISQLSVSMVQIQLVSSWILILNNKHISISPNRKRKKCHISHEGSILKYAHSRETEINNKYTLLIHSRMFRSLDCLYSAVTQ